MPQRKRTFDEVDAILAAISARQLHGVLFEPDPANLQFDLDNSIQLGHLSDKRDGTHVRKSRYNSLDLKEAYPIVAESGTGTSTVINVTTLTAGVSQADLTIGADRIHEVQFIRAIGNAPFAANRELDVYLYDGTNGVYIYRSGVAALVGTEDGLIFPTDEFTAAATYPGSRNSFDVHAATYLRLNAIGLAAAEEITIHVHWKVKDAGGLRQ